MTTATTSKAWLAVLAMLLMVPVAGAQDGILVSRSSDFSTEDLRFETGDVVHVLVKAPEIDATDIDQNEIRLRPSSGGEGFRQAMHNNFDGSYASRFELPSSADAVGKWLLEVRLRDKVGHEFEARLTIGVGSGADAHEFELEGLVTDVGDASIGVMHRKIAVTADTEIENEADQPIRLSDIHVGDRVHVRGIIRSDGTPVAVRIELKNMIDHEIEFTGMIEEVLDRAIVMFGRTIHVTVHTEIVNAEGHPIPFSELQAGMMVQVKVRITMDRIEALRIRVRNRTDFEFHVHGFITALRDRGFELEGHFIAVNEETEFIGLDDMPITFADLKVGDFVKVHGTLTPDRIPLARRVEVEERPGHREFEVEGFIREIGERAIAVNGLTIHVTDDTRILGLDDQPIEFGDLSEGDYVEVHGFVSADGKLIAKLIEVEDPERREISVAGEVQRVGDHVLVVKHIPFVVTDRTEIFDETGEPFPFSGIEPGMFVRVKGFYFPATRRAVALKIEVRTRRFVHLTGTINEIGDAAISVSGIRVFITDDTALLGPDGQPIEFADLQVGQIVKVLGWKTDGGVVARLVKVRLRVEDEVLVTGVLEAVEDSAVVVLGVTFRVISTTRITDAAGNELPLGELEVGRTVQIRGDLMADGTLVAFRIRQLERHARGIYVLGPIESIGPGTIEVIGIHFFVDGSTVIVGTAGKRIALSDLEVGQTVAIAAVGLPDGTRLAQKIRLLDVLVAMGDVDVLATDRVRMFGIDFLTDASLLVLQDGGRDASIGVDDKQALVEIRAATNEAGEMRVSRITLHQDSGSIVVTIDDGESEVPGTFRLGQNYPNPFNPSTTIELEVFESGPVEIAVYNILGQRLKTITQGVLSAGTYAFEWDGRDATGASAASGLYLYRASAGGTVQTRSMTLLK